MKAIAYLSDLMQNGLEGRFDRATRTVGNPGGAKFWPKPDWHNHGVKWINSRFGSALKQLSCYLWTFNRIDLDEQGNIVYATIKGKTHPHRINSGLMLTAITEDPDEIASFRDRLLEQFPKLQGRLITGAEAVAASIDNINLVQSLRLPGAMDAYDSVDLDFTLFLCIPASTVSDPTGYWCNQILRTSPDDQIPVYYDDKEPEF